MAEKKKKERMQLSEVWAEAKGLIWARRRRLGLGLLLTFVGSVAGLVLPGMTKPLIEDVLVDRKEGVLIWLVLAGGVATLIQASSAFATSQILGITAQRSITEMRKSVQRHVARLPIRYFDSTKSGVLISRIMTDAEGIRNLVGTGLVQFTGGIVRATFALIVLFYLNWRLTSMTLVVFVGFGAVMAVGFRRLRPLFRERGQINAEVTGRLAESLSGVRIVKAYTAEKREELVFARGTHRIFRNVAKSIVAVSSVTALSTVLFGGVALLIMYVGSRDVLNGLMDPSDLGLYVVFTFMV